MDLVNEELFSYIRSFLSFKEAHRVRLVSKKWVSLNSVKLHLFISNVAILPPPEASFTSINQLTIRSRAAREPNFLALYSHAIHHIISACSSKLERLHLNVSMRIESHFPLLKNITFPNLKIVAIWAPFSIWRLLKPKLHQAEKVAFRLTSDMSENMEIINFEDLPNLTTLNVNGDGYGSYFSLSNVPKTIKKIILEDIMEAGLLLHIISLLEGRKSVCIQLVRFYLCDDWNLDASIKDDVCKIEKARSCIASTLWISRDMGMKHFVRVIKQMNKNMKFVIGKTVTNDVEVLKFMKESGEFTRDEYKSMIL